jgi:hypothetical protein
MYAVTLSDYQRWLNAYSNDVIRAPRIVPVRNGLDGYEVFLDSPLGWETQGVCETALEAYQYAKENWDTFWTGR